MTHQTIVTFCMTHCLNTWFRGWPEVRPTAYQVLARQQNLTNFALAVDRTWKVRKGSGIHHDTQR